MNGAWEPHLASFASTACSPLARMSDRPGPELRGQQMLQRTPKNQFPSSQFANPGSTGESPVFLPLISVRRRRGSEL